VIIDASRSTVKAIGCKDVSADARAHARLRLACGRGWRLRGRPGARCQCRAAGRASKKPSFSQKLGFLLS